MAKKSILKTTMTSIADAVRNKTSVTGLLTPAQMIQAIKDIPSGGVLDYSAITTDVLQATNVLSGDAVGQFLTLAKCLTTTQIKPVFTDYDADITVDGSVYDISKLGRLFAVNSTQALTAVREYVVINPPIYVDDAKYILGESGIANGSSTVNLTLKNVSFDTEGYTVYMSGKSVIGKYKSIIVDGITVARRPTIDSFVINCRAGNMAFRNTSWGNMQLEVDSSLSSSAISKIEIDLSKFKYVSASYFRAFGDISNMVISAPYCTEFKYFANSSWSNASCQRIFEFEKISGTSTLNLAYAFAANRNISTFDFSKVGGTESNNLQNMFYNCTALESLGGDEITIKGNSINQMFYNCRSLNFKKLEIIGNLSYVSQVFYGCSSLTDVYLKIPAFSLSTGYASLFQSCSNLKTLTLHFTTNSTLNLVLTKKSMLSSTGALTDVTLITDSVVDSVSIFVANSTDIGLQDVQMLDMSGITTSDIKIDVLSLVTSGTSSEYTMINSIVFPPNPVEYDTKSTNLILSSVSCVDGVGSNFVKSFSKLTDATYSLTLKITQTEYDKLSETERTNFTSNGGVLEIAT